MNDAAKNNDTVSVCYSHVGIGNAFAALVCTNEKGSSVRSCPFSVHREDGSR
jgi:hypothetical protein